MDVGAYLRGAREQRGLSLEQVSKSTKLSPGVLQLIEHNEWNRLPGGLVTRGHLRAYASEVKVSPEDVVHEYLAQLPTPAIPPAPTPRIRATRPSLPTRQWTVVAGIVIAAGTYVWLTTPRAVPSPQVSDAVQAPAQESLVSNQAAATPALTPQPSPIALAIDVTGPCWVSVRADQQLAVFRLFEAGEAATVTANEQLVLRVGDAGTFHYTVNGVPGRPLGEAGQPVTVTITRDNVETFTDAPARVRRGET